MITIPQQTWWELTEEFFDDSAGPVEEPVFTVEILDHNLVALHFADPREETLWRLRWLK